MYILHFKCYKLKVNKNFLNVIDVRYYFYMLFSYHYAHICYIFLYPLYCVYIYTHTLKKRKLFNSLFKFLYYLYVVFWCFLTSFFLFFFILSFCFYIYVALALIWSSILFTFPILPNVLCFFFNLLFSASLRLLFVLSVLTWWPLSTQMFYSICCDWLILFVY